MSGRRQKTPAAGIHFRKSQASGGSDNCVEVALVADQILLRHSKDKDGTVLIYTRDEWAAFLDGAIKGEFDLEALQRPAH